jgi:ubiquitin C-terminal hydrolase
VENSTIIRHGIHSPPTEPQSANLQESEGPVKNVPSDQWSQVLDHVEQIKTNLSGLSAQAATTVLDHELSEQSKPISPPKVISWASLLRNHSSATSGSSMSTNSLPTSSVVGFSIPAEKIPQVPDHNEVQIVKLLTSRSTKSSEPHRLVSRGLLNLGNMCFANIILQGLVYTFPFWSLIRELKRLGLMPKKSSKGAPLLNAT